MKASLAQAKVQGFVEVLAAKDAEDGISALYVHETDDVTFTLRKISILEYKQKA